MQGIWLCELGVSRRGEFAAPVGHCGKRFHTVSSTGVWVEDTVRILILFIRRFRDIVENIFTILVAKYFLKCESMKEQYIIQILIASVLIILLESELV